MKLSKSRLERIRECVHAKVEFTSAINIPLLQTLIVKKLILILPLIVALLIPTMVFAQDHISGYDTTKTSQITLNFADSTVSGSLIIDGKTISLENPTVITRDDRKYIVDDTREIKILVKEKDSKYLILSKYNDGNTEQIHRYIIYEKQHTVKTAPIISETRTVETPQQETLQQSSVPAQVNTEHSQLVLDLKLAQQAEQKHRERLQKLEEQESLKPTSESILAAYEQSKIPTGMTLVTEEPPVPDTAEASAPKVLQTGQMQIFPDIPHHVLINDALKFSLLVTDSSKANYDVGYKSFVGNKLDAAQVTGDVLNPHGEIIKSFSGETVDGIYSTSNAWLVPDNTSTRGEYKVKVEITFEDMTPGSIEKGFYVFPRGDDNPYMYTLEVERLGIEEFEMAFDKWNDKYTNDTTPKLFQPRIIDINIALDALNEVKNEENLNKEDIIATAIDDFLKGAFKKLTNEGKTDEEQSKKVKRDIGVKEYNLFVYPFVAKMEIEYDKVMNHDMNATAISDNPEVTQNPLKSC